MSNQTTIVFFSFYVRCLRLEDQPFLTPTFGNFFYSAESFSADVPANNQVKEKGDP